jgi:tripartite-type tricarboxylate transporter receptor subunit TctC
MRPALSVLFSILLSVSAFAAEPYPSKIIRLVVPNPPGGITDTIGRLLSDGLRKSFDQTVIVENKSGGMGTIGTRDVVRAEPDGYTLLLQSLGVLTIPYALDSKYPIDPVKDLTPVAGVAEFATVLIVNPKTPVHSVQEFITYAKERPGKLTFGSAGIGSVNHLSTELFMKQTGISMVHVPYRGGNGAINDLLGERLDVILEVFPIAMPQIQAGGVRALVVTTPYRLPDLPNVPTSAESGVPNIQVTGWLGLFGPAGIPADVTDKVSNAVVQIIKEPEMQKKLRAIGFEPTGMPAKAFGEFNKSETDRWMKIITEIGLRK